MPSVPKPHSFSCKLAWTGADAGAATDYKTYSRDLRLEIDGKPALKMSAAGAFRGDESAHNPEDLLMGALSACHCLSYLALAVRQGVTVVAYSDDASGTMEWVDKTFRFTSVVLRPRVTVKKGSDLEKARALHEEAHAACFIAQSVNFPVTNEPVIVESEDGQD
ncbi:MAG: OsmC family protein [Polyangiaceae bacterium]